MKIFKSIFLVLFSIFLSLSAFSTFTIKIYASAYKGKTARLISEEDPISRKFNIIATAKVKEDGSVYFEGNTDEIKLYTINIDNVNARLFISPESDYSLVFPELKEGQARSINNTNSVDLLFNNIAPNDINTLVTAFNLDYYNFYNNNAKYVGSPGFRSKVKSFEDSVASRYGKIKNSYFQNYITYSVAETKLLNAYSKKDLYDSLLAEKPFQLNNPAWFQFFNLFYAEYFETFQVKFASVDLPRLVNRGSLHALDSAFKQDDFMKDDLLRRLVIVKSIKENYSNVRYEKPKLLSILREIITLDIPVIFDVAVNVESRLMKNQVGTAPEDYLLTNSKGELVRLNRLLTGKDTYLEISSAWCSSCKKESRYIQDLKKEYGELFQFITILIETDSSEFQNYLKQVPDDSTEVYLANDSYSLRTELNIRTIPSYFLLDDEGKLTQMFAIKPSEGIEAVFFKVKTAKIKENKIRVGDK